MKTGFIGCGKMATALIQGMLGSGAFSADETFACDVVHEAVETLADTCGIRALPDAGALVSQVDAVLLCVKPQDALAVVRSVNDALAGKLLISIAAGIGIESLNAAAGGRARVIRVMPNTPALVHKGAAAYACGPGVTGEDTELAEKIFSSVGLAFQVRESLLDAVTGLSGSGPAYVYLVIESLADGGVRMGLPRDLALQLAAQTVLGAAQMVTQTAMHPALLKDMVASPGGTTMAGLEQLERCGVRAAFLGAVRAATEKSIELGETALEATHPGGA